MGRVDASKYIFESKLAPLMYGFIKEKLNSGYYYYNEARVLYSFDQFIIANDFDYGRIDAQLLSRWCELGEHELPNSRKSRVDAIRVFIHYLRGLGIESAEPPRFKFKPRNIPYIPSFNEILTFFKHIDTLSPKLDKIGLISTDSAFFKRFQAPVLFRFYYCMGLRENEGIHIKISNLNFNSGKLLIDYAKADKHRYVFLPPDLLQLTERYFDALQKEKLFSQWLFPRFSNPELPVSDNSVREIFKQEWSRGVAETLHKKQTPTIHNLRHCFVVHKITQWCAAGQDIHALLPYLSRHLGHSSVANTYTYFHEIEHMCPAVKTFLNFSGLPGSVYDFQKD